MKAAPSSRRTPAFITLLTNLQHSPQQHDGDLVSYSDGSAETSAIPRSSEDRDPDWDRTAAFSDDVASETNLPAARHAEEPASVLFPYFHLLCEYHGAVRVPRFWAALLAGGSIGTSELASASNLNARKVNEMNGSAGGFFSPTSTLDFTACYVGPTTLLALADLCRVHRATLAGRHRSAATGVVVTAVAPLWSKRKPYETEEACSLLPLLRTLRLTRLALDFSDGDVVEHRGNKVLHYLLEALQGHPRLVVLDLSSNPIASALVPALSRLVQSTPSLTTLVLEDTLVLAEEKKMLSAQCLLNQLRLERGKTTATTPSTELSAVQASWCMQTQRSVQRAVDVGVSAVPWLLGTCTRCVRRYSGPCFVASASTSATVRTNGVRGSTSCATFDAIGASSRTALLQSFRSSTDATYFCCYDTAEWSGQTSSTAPAASKESEATASRSGTVWTPECVNVIRTAFLGRQVARERVLGGRAVWPNVPLPIGAEDGGEPSNSTAVTASHDEHRGDHRPTTEDLSSSALLRSIRQQLLPPPQASPGMRHDTDTAFLTTAEENYWTVRQTQERQWGHLVARLRELLEPVRLHDNEVLYADGDSCSPYIYFLPAEAESSSCEVALLAAGETNRVRPGEWVGEAEALGCIALYPNATAVTTMASSRSTNANPTNPLGASLPFTRLSTARFHTSSRDGATVWALPFPIAFFYLYMPYQQLQQQFMQRTPMSSFAHIHPVHLASVPVQLELFHWTRNATPAAQRTAMASTVLCTASYLADHLVLLQEGEYLLRVPPSAVGLATAAAAAEERHLLSGNAVVSQAMLDLDADARASGDATAVADYPLGPAGPGGVRALGKEAALRQFRQRKAAASQLPASRTTGTTAAAAGNGTPNQRATETDNATEESVELRPYPSSTPVAHWRYAGLSAEAFAGLCPPLRLALTRHCCVIPDEV